jgi:erythronate-4-phosphate dehydrogenase
MLTVWFTTFIPPMKIVIDDKIPFIRGVFDPYAEVLYLPGGEIRREHLRDADYLIVRTRTQCNRDLLENTRIRFIATATIGFDHIDTSWCEKNGIAWTNAPGCNSGSVAHYIAAALHTMANRMNFDLKDKTLGIIGVGHVGKKVEQLARLLRMKVILNDPPRERTEGSEAFTDLVSLLKNSDIITVHVPLNRQGPDKTIDLVNMEFLQTLKPGAILINSSRGEVVNEKDTVRVLREPGGLGGVILDVWQNEPDINRELLGMAEIATPHIAGYSLDGKLNATRMVVNAVVKEFGIEIPVLSWTLDGLILKAFKNNESNLILQDYILATYDITADDLRLRDSPGTFEQQRNNYPVRREFSAYAIDPFPEGDLGRILTGLGFKH